MSVTLYNDIEVNEEDAVCIDTRVIEDTRLSSRSIVVYAYILGCDGEVNNQSIADNMHMSLRTVYRAIAELAKFGYYYQSSDGTLYMGSTEQSAYELYLDKENKDD